MRSKFLLNLTACCGLALTISSCEGKVINEQTIQSTDSLTTKKIFAEYVTNSCLLNLFVSIVESNKKFYSSKEFFYSVTFKRNNGNRRLTIDARLWNTPGNQKYKGVMKIASAFFLCSGDIEKDSLFKVKKGSVIKTPLKEESVDNESYPYAEEPILKGKFIDCKDKPVYVEVYTKGKVW